MVGGSQTYLPYHEPTTVTVLILTSFILFLNCAGWIIDNALSCGLVAQILLGVGWGVPGANWINVDAQKTILQLGYLGLLLMVFEGGLTTPFKEMKENLLLSFVIALTGIGFPIALSFSLLGFSDVSPVAAFASGAALCSTSLGTAFTILSTSKLRTTKVGILLTNAAVFDDIVGLVMMKVVSNLGEGSFTAVSVIRPVFVSAALIVIVSAVCWLVMRPLTKIAYNRRFENTNKFVRGIFRRKEFYFVTHTLLLIGLVTATSYAGASSLTAAYVTGAAISWWDNEVILLKREVGISKMPSVGLAEDNVSEDMSSDNYISPSAHIRGRDMFEHFYAQPLNKLLKPFFFGSIGFSIPIKQMFQGRLVWRGIVYTVLMFVSKVICGMWMYIVSCYYHVKERKTKNRETSSDRQKYDFSSSSYAGALLGLSMVPRGEIGFLVSSLAESAGVFSGGSRKSTLKSSDTYVIVTWAIVLCTIIAPIGIGFLARKIKKSPGEHNVLGDWGLFEGLREKS